MHKWKAAVSGGIWTTVPQWAAEFCELDHGIWQNFPRKTVGRTYYIIIIITFFYYYTIQYNNI